MIHEDAENIIIHVQGSYRSKYTYNERSLRTLGAKTHDFVEYFLANDLFWYKYIEYKLKCCQLTSGKQNVHDASSICRVKNVYGLSRKGTHKIK